VIEDHTIARNVNTIFKPLLRESYKLPYGIRGSDFIASSYGNLNRPSYKSIECESNGICRLPVPMIVNHLDAEGNISGTKQEEEFFVTSPPFKGFYRPKNGDGDVRVLSDFTYANKVGDESAEQIIIEDDSDHIYVFAIRPSWIFQKEYIQNLDPYSSEIKSVAYLEYVLSS
jgi:hypothetical protein